VSSHYCTAAILNKETAPRRFEIVEKLKAAGVGTSVYYPVAVPHLAYYKQKYKTPDGAFPHASRISNDNIALPVGPHLGPDDMKYIAMALKKAIKETA
jgi:dTDP-4-amino-4,6-dideoxygalactose transaminase